MPSAQSVAIREELAIERIKKATERLRQEHNEPIPAYDLGDRRVHPQERTALVLEWAAGVLESFSPAPEPKDNAETEGETQDGDLQRRSGGDDLLPVETDAQAQADAKTDQEDQTSQAPPLTLVETDEQAKQGDVPLTLVELSEQAQESEEAEADDNANDNESTGGEPTTLITKNALRRGKTNGGR